MPNVLDIHPLCALSKRASAKIGDEKVAKRFERLAVDSLLRDARNFRSVCAADLQCAPDWAREAHARGETLSVFKSNRSASVRVHAVARRLADTCRVAATDHIKRPANIASIKAAREFLAKFDRVDFETAARKALNFSRLLSCWDEDADAQLECPEQTLVLLRGRVWGRVTSVAGLRAVGKEFANCLAQTKRASGYGAMLAQGSAQFWVLRDYEGAGLMVAMAPAPVATRFMEVKGPRNAPIRPDNIDLTQLGLAIGIRPTPPPPPAPSGGVLALVLAARGPCRCALCNPRLSQRERLRPHAAAP